MKQQTLAATIGVSQGYISRLEGDKVEPAGEIAERILQLLDSHEHLSFGEQVARAVRLSPHMVCLISGRPPFTLLAKGAGNHSDASPFSECEENTARHNPKLEEFRAGLERIALLRREGDLATPVAHIWRCPPGEGGAALKSVHIPIRLHQDRWVWHCTSVFLSDQEYSAILADWGDTLVIDPQLRSPGGSFRLSAAHDNSLK
jgi:transcriptional regulator with XRE-family HTH domain